MCACAHANLELSPGVELSQLLHSLWQVDFVGVPVPLLRNPTQKGKLVSLVYSLGHSYLMTLVVLRKLNHAVGVKTFPCFPQLPTKESRSSYPDPLEC